MHRLALDLHQILVCHDRAETLVDRRDLLFRRQILPSIRLPPHVALAPPHPSQRGDPVDLQPHGIEILRDFRHHIRPPPWVRDPRQRVVREDARHLCRAEGKTEPGLFYSSSGASASFTTGW